MAAGAVGEQAVVAAGGSPQSCTSRRASTSAALAGSGMVGFRWSAKRNAKLCIAHSIVSKPGEGGRCALLRLRLVCSTAQSTARAIGCRIQVNRAPSRRHYEHNLRRVSPRARGGERRDLATIASACNANSRCARSSRVLVQFCTRVQFFAAD